MDLALQRLLRPGAVAVVGATDRPGSYGATVMANLVGGGFRGDVLPVNPRRDVVAGLPCRPALDAWARDRGTAPDLVVVAVPAESVPDVVEQAAAVGAGAVIVISSGFAEAGGAGTARQHRVREIASAAGLPVLGPNGNGLVSVPGRLAAWGDPLDLSAHPTAGGVALVTASGNVGVNALAVRRGPRLSYVVSVGNQAVLGVPDIVRALAGDPDVRSVALYLESDGDGAELADALSHCVRHGVGIAVLRAGRSLAGALAAGTHTGGLITDARVTRALVEVAGGAWVEDPHTLLEVAGALAASRPAPAPSTGRGVVVVTASGGDAALAADLADRLAVPLAAADPTRLAAALPAGVSPANPLDLTDRLWADRVGVSAATAALGATADVVLVLQDVPPDLPPDAAAEWAATRDGGLDGARAAGLPAVLASTLPDLLPAGVAAAAATDGVAAVAGLPAALAAVSALRARADGPAGPRPEAAVDRLAAIAETASAARDRRAAPAPGGQGPALDQHAGKRLLAGAGVPVPASVVLPLTAAADSLAAATADVPGPWAVKVVAPGLLHTVAEDGVRLSVTDPVTAAAAVRSSAAARRPGARLLVESMAATGIEVLVAARDDGTVPHLVVGLGGAWTETLDDAVLIPLPADAADVADAIGRLRGAVLLLGAPGYRRRDVGSLASVAAAVGRLVQSGAAHLVELNPVIVHESGVTAVDAVVVPAGGTRPEGAPWPPPIDRG